MYEHADHNWWFVAKRQVVAAMLHAMAAGGPLGDLLDVGCGTGEILAHLGNGRSVGMDIAREALGYSRRRGVRRLVLADSRRLPWRPGSFDTILCLDHLEHVEDDVEALRGLAALLRPGGRVLVSVPAHRYLWTMRDDVLHHYRRYSLRELQARAAAAGLEACRITHSNMLLFPVLALLCLWSRLTGRQSGRLPPDLHLARPLVNRSVISILGLEARMLRRLNLPIGSTLLLVGRKPAVRP